MAIPFIDLSNVKKWFAGTGSGVPTDPYILQLSRSVPAVAAMSSTIISINSIGDTALIAGVASQTIRVHRLIISYAASPVTVLIKDGASTTLLTQPLNTYGNMVLDYDGEPLFVTTAGNGLWLNLSSAVQIYGRVWYTQG